MSEDGQGWVWDELGQRVVGLSHRTPRAQVHTTALLGYKGDLADGCKALRCDRLDLDLAWEGQARNNDRKFTGHAKVTLRSQDNTDVVSVQVELDPLCQPAAVAAAGSTDQESDRMVRDVVYAVKSLDSQLMQQLNDFLWQMETRNAHASLFGSDESGPECMVSA